MSENFSDKIYFTNGNRQLSNFQKNNGKFNGYVPWDLELTKNLKAHFVDVPLICKNTLVGKNGMELVI